MAPEAIEPVHKGVLLSSIQDPDGQHPTLRRNFRIHDEMKLRTATPHTHSSSPITATRLQSDHSLLFRPERAWATRASGQPLGKEDLSVIDWGVFGVPDLFVTELSIEIGFLKGVRVHADDPAAACSHLGLNRVHELAAEAGSPQRGRDPEPFDHGVATPTEAVDSGLKVTPGASQKAAEGPILAIPGGIHVVEHQLLAQLGDRGLIMSLRDSDLGHFSNGAGDGGRRAGRLADQTVWLRTCRATTNANAMTRQSSGVGALPATFHSGLRSRCIRKGGRSPIRTIPPRTNTA